MNAFSITGLFVAIPSIILCVFTLIKRRRKIHIIWGLFALFIGLWGFGIYMISVTTDMIKAIFWWRVAEIGVIFIPVLLIHFVLEFLNLRKKLFLSVFYIVTFFLLFCDIFTNYFIDQVRFVFDKFYYISPATPLYTFFVFVIFIGSVIYSIMLLWRAYKKAHGISKYQIKYLILAFLIGFTGGATSYLPVYNIDILPVWNAAIFLSALIVAYAIVKCRFMDIRVTVKKSSLFSLVVIGVGTAYVLVAFLLSSLVFGGELTGIKHLIITGLIVGTIVAIGFRPLYSFLQEVTDKYFFKGAYNPQELIRNISSQLATALEVKEISDILKENIEKDMRLEGVSLMLIERNREYFTQREIPFKDELVSDLISYLKENKETLVLEELERYYQEHPWKYDKRYLAYRNLKKTNKAVVLPVYVKSETEGERVGSSFTSSLSESGIKTEDSLEKRMNKRKVEELSAFIFLGPKKSGDVFTVQDINTLEIIASQVGVALENALMYERVKHFSEILRKEVERQTKELREANIRLKQLDKAKSEFISIASHQLRTPLTAIKGLVSMALEGFWGPLNEEQKKHLKEVYNSGERLLKLIEDLLDVSRIESGKMEFEFQPVNLYNLTKEVAEELKPQAKKKGLYLEVVPPKKKLPSVKADPLKIRQVIQNLIDNGIKYTLRGGVRIRFKKEKNKVIFSIADTGMGIPKDTIPLLFEKFHRGKEAIRKHTEGTGLGLYLCARLIEAHNGKIWVESEGEGKGSTFYFSLPRTTRKPRV